MVFLGIMLAALGVSTLVWRDADLVGLPPVAVGVALLLLGAGSIALGVTRRKRRRVARGEPEPVGSVVDRAKALPRLLRARKAYGLPTTRLAQWGFALVYLVSPIDVLPEFLPLIGVTDDAGVAVWLLTSLSTAAGQYLSWERSKQQDRRP
ncbi:YkvA family protein [Actinosynnema sp. NPDC050436]|uniref:YkvA family protein n=1 Tax=Actinosynnema sp. NPDC050436 TaxID=3155659 RepID=UPI0033E74683